jgi:hypothetical protein
MRIDSISDFRSAVRHGPYAWPGGYPVYFVCDDGSSLCTKCVNEERRNILESIARKSRDGWRVIGADINYEDNMLHCEHCNERIESAYAD